MTKKDNSEEKVQCCRDRVTYEVYERLGYVLCELAFKTGCRGPFAYAYRAGCWCYGKGLGAGIRCGVLVSNPAYRGGLDDEPQYIERRGWPGQARP